MGRAIAPVRLEGNCAMNWRVRSDFWGPDCAPGGVADNAILRLSISLMRQQRRD
jgi:hypothetical protein